MTEQEAIKLLKAIDIREASQEDYDAINMGIDALELQISKKLIIKLHTNRISSEQEEPYCPICDEWIGWASYGENYCNYCGQSLDWSDVELSD